MRWLVGLVALVLFAVAGCGGDDDADSSLPEHSPSASESQSAEASESPAVEGLLEKPERPEDEKSDAGAKAFGKYALEAANFTYYNAKPGLLRALAPSSGDKCVFCEGTIKSAKKAQRDGLVYRLKGPIRFRNGRGFEDGNNSFAQWEIKTPNGREVDTTTGEVGIKHTTPDGWISFTVLMRWEGSKWQIAQISPDEESN